MTTCSGAVQTFISSTKMKRFIVLPFVGKKSEDFAYRLKNHVESHFPQLDFNAAQQTPASIGGLFPYKDRIKEVEAQSFVVLKLTCNNCQSTYIGKSKRILYHRMHEHESKGESACFQHLKENPKHSIDYRKIEIIDRASNDLKLRIKERLHILSSEPEMNKQLSSQLNHELKTILVKAHPLQQHRRAA